MISNSQISAVHMTPRISIHRFTSIQTQLYIFFATNLTNKQYIYQARAVTERQLFIQSL